MRPVRSPAHRNNGHGQTKQRARANNYQRPKLHAPCSNRHCQRGPSIQCSRTACQRQHHRASTRSITRFQTASAFIGMAPPRPPCPSPGGVGWVGGGAPQARPPQLAHVPSAAILRRHLPAPAGAGGGRRTRAAPRRRAARAAPAGRSAAAAAMPVADVAAVVDLPVVAEAPQLQVPIPLHDLGAGRGSRGAGRGWAATPLHSMPEEPRASPRPALCAARRA
jgi:hypothetical protein